LPCCLLPPGSPWACPSYSSAAPTYQALCLEYLEPTSTLTAFHRSACVAAMRVDSAGCRACSLPALQAPSCQHHVAMQRHRTKARTRNAQA
jgi:hypothetical protein